MPSPALACSYVWLVLLFLILHQGLYHSLLCHNIRLIFSLLLPAWLLYVTELDSCLDSIWQWFGGSKTKPMLLALSPPRKLPVFCRTLISPADYPRLVPLGILD